jgi:hypothetical protein
LPYSGFGKAIAPLSPMARRIYRDLLHMVDENLNMMILDENLLRWELLRILMTRDMGILIIHPLLYFLKAEQPWLTAVIKFSFTVHLKYEPLGKPKVTSAKLQLVSTHETNITPDFVIGVKSLGNIWINLL